MQARRPRVTEMTHQATAISDVRSQPADLGGSTPRHATARRAPVECGDLPFLIKRDGTWLYRGSPIGRKELVCLFASVLKRDEHGQFWLETRPSSPSSSTGPAWAATSSSPSAPTPTSW
jgi:hypothetical protein